jgi:uncharacterized protein (DUF2235 family)
MKRIVICCDGTWNNPDEAKDGVPVPTNVVKLAGSILRQADDGTEQLMYYNTGVGTEGSWLRRVIDGATGHGIARNIQEAYYFLIQHYQPGDKLFFFGFSRGAFTVRSLSGLVRNCGILRLDALDLVSKAFLLYRNRSARTSPRARESVLFRRTYAVEEITPLEFIGVWDTVGSLGNPLLLGKLSPQNQFHDTDLSSTVHYAYQALAIDEKRRNFSATLWHQPQKIAGQVLEQMWFAGVHADVGGGYAESGLSDVALQWLAEKAAAAGLGLAKLECQPDPFAPLEESWRFFYRLLAPLYRPIGRPSKEGSTNESIHPSVLARRARDSNYRPRNLEEYLADNPI